MNVLNLRQLYLYFYLNFIYVFIVTVNYRIQQFLYFVNVKLDRKFKTWHVSVSCL